MMALMIGSRLASHLLAANMGSKTYLPDIYPAVPGISRMNRTVSESSRLLLDAENHLAAMAIPHVQGTFESLVDSVVTLLIKDGKTQPTLSDRKRGLMGKLKYVACQTNMTFDAGDLQLIDLVRCIRNCIIHNGSRPDERLTNVWNNLSQSAVSQWIKITGRELPIHNNRIKVKGPELVATLAIAKHMAREASDYVAKELKPSTWSVVIVEDFLSNYEKTIPTDSAQLRKKVFGWSRMYYQSAGIQDTCLEAELLKQGYEK